MSKTLSDQEYKDLLKQAGLDTGLGTREQDLEAAQKIRAAGIREGQILINQERLNPAPVTDDRPFREQFDTLNDAGDTAGARKLLDDEWKRNDVLTAKNNAIAAARAAGLEIKEGN